MAMKIAEENKVKGTVCAFVAMALFGLYAIFGKLLMLDTSPFVILMLIQALAGIILILLLDLFNKMREISRTSSHKLRVIFLIALLASVIAPLFFLFGLRLTSVTNSVLIGRLQVFFTSLFAVFFLKDRITKQQLVGVLIIVLGMLLIATDNFSLGFSFQIGDVFILFSAFFYACATILAKKYLFDMHPEAIVTLRNLIGALILFFLSIFFVDYSEISNIFSFRFAITLLGAVIFTTIMSQYLWYKALSLISASQASIITLSSPIIVIFYAIFLLDESISASQILGGACIIAGLIVLESHFRIVYSKNDHRWHLRTKSYPHV